MPVWIFLDFIVFLNCIRFSSSKKQMSDIIQEERESIIRDTNTAQTQLENIIQNLKPETIDLNVQSEFFGELDLSVLETKFPRLKSLLLGPGKITSIRNIPSGISKLVCNNNLLMGLERLPGSLLYLDVDHNYLKTLDLSKTPYLEEVHCNDNRLENILHLPQNITKLYCEQNQLQKLDVSGLPHLKVLHVSNNPLLVVNGVAENIHEFVSENNPLAMETTSYNYEENDDENNDKIKIADKKQTENVKIKYLDALQIYFKLKQEYEMDLLKRRRIAFKKSTTKTGGVKRSKAVKGKCVQCKRIVGMNFSNNSEGYVARCGDPSHPCGLSIKLLRGNFSSNEYYLYLFKEQLEKEKIEIIRQKLDSLFSYISEESSVKQFKKILDSYNDLSGTYGDLTKRNNELYHDLHKAELITKKREKIYKILAQIKSMIHEYKTDGHTTERQHSNYGGSTGLLRTAMEVYVNDLLPEVENLRRLKHDVNEMEDNVVFQKGFSLQKLEYTYGDLPSVEKFRGIK